MITCKLWKLKYLQWSGCSVCLLRLKKGIENVKHKIIGGGNGELKSASRLWFTIDLWIPEMSRAPWACQESQRQVLAHSSSSAGTPRGPDMMRRLLSSAGFHCCSTENELFTQGRDRRCFREPWPMELSSTCRSHRGQSRAASQAQTPTFQMKQKVGNAFV